MNVLRPSGYEVKLAVIQRDGLGKGCYWCGKPFFTSDDATLEHIIPLADGGAHDLNNCALACEPCNLKNIPQSVKKKIYEDVLTKAIKARENRLANGGMANHTQIIRECPVKISDQFEAINRSRNGKPLTFADASHLLKTIHKRLLLPPPTKIDKDIFRAHFNRWANENSPVTYPSEYVSPFGNLDI